MTRTFKIVLVASLALNILLAGMFAGEALRRLSGPPNPADFMEKRLEKFPAESRAPVKAMIERIREQNKPVQQKIEASKKELERIMTAETFDEAAYRKELETMRSLRSDMRGAMADEVMAIAKTMSREQRVALADMLRRPPPFSSRGGKGEGRDMPPPPGEPMGGPAGTPPEPPPAP